MDKKIENTANTNEPLKGIKGFRASSDVENFYRFVYESGLRREAKMILESISATFNKGKKKKKSRKKVH